MLSHQSLDVDGWASAAYPSPSNKVYNGIPLGFAWALDMRSRWCRGPEFLPWVLRVKVFRSRDTVWPSAFSAVSYS